MNFRIHNNPVTLGRDVAAPVKQWGFGWTVSEASQAANRRAGQDRFHTPGMYGVLAAGGRLGTMR